MFRAIAAVAAMLCTSAHATAVYEWQSINDDTRGRFEITDAAQAAGSLRTTIDGRGVVGNPDSPLLTFQFADLFANLPDTTPGSERLELFILDLDLTGAMARGSIFGETSLDQVVMASNPGELWTVSRYASENPSTGCRPNGAEFTGCSGERGRWVLTSDGAGRGRVPLPGTLALVAMGGFALGGALRKRKD